MNHYFINGSFTESFENIGNNNRPTYNLIDNRRVIEGFATTVTFTAAQIGSYTDATSFPATSIASIPANLIPLINPSIFPLFIFLNVLGG